MSHKWVDPGHPGVQLEVWEDTWSYDRGRETRGLPALVGREFLRLAARVAELEAERTSVISATHALVAEFNSGAGWPATDPPPRPLDLLLFEVQDALRGELTRLREENAALTEALGRDDKTLAVLDQEIQAWMALEERARKAIEEAELLAGWSDAILANSEGTTRHVVGELVAVVRAFLADEEEETGGGES